MTAPPAPTSPRAPAPTRGTMLVARPPPATPEANSRAKPPVTTGKLTGEIKVALRRNIVVKLKLTAGTIIFASGEDRSSRTTEVIVSVQLLAGLALLLIVAVLPPQLHDLFPAEEEARVV